MIGAATPGVDELGSVGEDQKDPRPRRCSPEAALNASSELLSIQWRSSTAMIRGLISEPLRVILFLLRASRVLSLPGFGAHLHLLDAAFPSRGEKLQQVGQRGGFIHLDALEETDYLRTDLLTRIVILNLEVWPSVISTRGLIGRRSCCRISTGLPGRYAHPRW